MANPENKQIPYESTQKDIRDAIESVATAIGGIAIPSADHVSYDNSGSGLSATDVQNALDEIVSDIPTVNNGTLTIQQNGTSKGSFTANSASNVNVNIETPTADKKTATDQFTTADGGLLSKCMIDLVPVQSGSGDPSPDNVRPISGHTEVDLDVKDGDNVTQHTYQVQIGSTVYGGYVDLVSGVMTVDRFYFSLNGTENFTLFQAGSTNPRRFTLNITSAFSAPSIDFGFAGELSSHFKQATVALTNPWGVFRFSISGSNMVLILPDANSVFASDTDVENYFATQYANGTPAQFSYKIATPFTIQLTPQQIEALVGQNNLSCPLDGQSIETNGVEYREVFAFDDVEKVVSLRVPISMLGTDESGRTTASQSYASGDYFYKDGYMCKALTSISAGATLTLNTNYSQGTLADILKAIENS